MNCPSPISSTADVNFYQHETWVMGRLAIRYIIDLGKILSRASSFLCGGGFYPLNITFLSDRSSDVKDFSIVLRVELGSIHFTLRRTISCFRST